MGRLNHDQRQFFYSFRLEEPALQPEPSVDDRSGSGFQRVDHVLAGFRFGFCLFEPVHERAHVGESFGHRGTRGVEYQGAQGGGNLRQVYRQVEAAVPVQPFAQGGAVRGGPA